MKYLKFSFLFLVLAILLASCSRNIHRVAVPNAIDNAVYIDTKNLKLTDEQLDNWQHYNLTTDSIPGMNMIKAYQFLKVKNKKAQTTIVAVIDSGMDIEHEDLKEHIWVNPKEIPGNGIDDDKNGYIDDINGWNFLGDKYDENLEITRMVKLYQDEFKGKSLADFKGKEQLRYKEYKELEEKVKEQYAAGKKVYYDLGFHKSAQALRDNEYNFNKRIYGNGTVMYADPTEMHATHVAGIIGATRDNQLGINGVSSTVKIMSVRVVPAGDEYDKDVAMGIRYAADNGAKVINMSFGKAYSPDADKVAAAMKYAAEHDVLILHSAGNSGNDIDIDHTYPNDAPDYKKAVSDNVLTIGALNPVYSDKLPAAFSNYGKESVDIFAPGVKILSSTPGGKYHHFSGTSMATPAAAGVAAMIRSYYPSLSASQVKHIIMNSGTKINKVVRVPGSNGALKPFSELCVSGRIVDAYGALIMAEKMVKK